MLENLPPVFGQALSGQRAGLDQIVFNLVDLGPGTAAITVTSAAFIDHAPIPQRYTADGEGETPPLTWNGVPSAAAALALIVEDADSPTPHPVVHLLVVDLPAVDGDAAANALAEDPAEAVEPAPTPGAMSAAAPQAAPSASSPARGDAIADDAETDGNREGTAIARTGLNSLLGSGWLPPDPPPGHGVHRYAFQVFALGPDAAFSATPGRDELIEAIRQHGLASGLLIGTYARDTQVTERADAVTAPAVGPAGLAS